MPSLVATAAEGVSDENAAATSGEAEVAMPRRFPSAVSVAEDVNGTSRSNDTAAESRAEDGVAHERDHGHDATAGGQQERVAPVARDDAGGVERRAAPEKRAAKRVQEEEREPTAGEEDATRAEEGGADAAATLGDTEDSGTAAGGDARRLEADVSRGKVAEQEASMADNDEEHEAEWGKAEQAKPVVIENERVPEESGITAKIIAPGPHDILCGRGGGANSNPGNVRFRKFVAACRPRYLAASRGDKRKIIRDMLWSWQAQDPPGRILARDADGDGRAWCEVDEQRALNKVAQCLREQNTLAIGESKVKNILGQDLLGPPGRLRDRGKISDMEKGEGADTTRHEVDNCHLSEAIAASKRSKEAGSKAKEAHCYRWKAREGRVADVADAAAASLRIREALCVREAARPSARLTGEIIAARGRQMRDEILVWHAAAPFLTEGEARGMQDFIGGARWGAAMLRKLGWEVKESGSADLYSL